MNKRRLILFILLVIVLLPFWMWLAWLLTPKKKMVVAIIDKTVMTKDGQEHASFIWVLNHCRFTKNKTKLYKAGNDYFGFFPMKDKNFRIKGLERFSADMLEKLSNDADMTYFTDTYGIYRNEWYLKQNIEERSNIVYGGMSEQDIAFLRDMKAKHKLIITEFNTIGSPTNPEIRSEFENMFGLKWSGWTGRYFTSLDTTINTELPKWLIRNYKSEHGEQWPFHSPGIAFVNNSDYVVIIEEKTHLTDAMPYIESNQYGQEKFGLPQRIKYPYWFDIMQPDTSVNKIIAEFTLNLNAAGKAELKKNNIPFYFPAITMHRGTDYQFYYFSGDFCDNPVNMTTSYFKGIRFFKSFFYKSSNPGERGSFFWNFYQPMMITIINDYYNQLRKN
ncbi:MAG TPA: hypothetical protein VET23_00395 [Chitinophagaceae bacterium]|nr:hypothetical protein [Chitinophagaceae bacterium]